MHKFYNLLFAGMPEVILTDYPHRTETLLSNLGISLWWECLNETKGQGKRSGMFFSAEFLIPFTTITAGLFAAFKPQDGTDDANAG